MLDLLFLSLPTGQSQSRGGTMLPPELKVIDVGGDHRFVDGWTYGLTEVIGPAVDRGEQPGRRSGLFPRRRAAGAAPLVCRGLVEPDGHHRRRQDRASAAPAAAAARPSASPR